MKPILAGLFAMALWAQYVPPGGGGGTPTTPGTPVNSIQFNNPLGTFAGDVTFTWLGSENPGGLALGPAEATLPAFIQGYTSPQNALITATGGFHQGLGVEKEGSGQGIFAVTWDDTNGQAGYGVEGDAYAVGTNQFIYGLAGDALIRTGATGTTAYGVEGYCASFAGSTTKCVGVHAFIEYFGGTVTDSMEVLAEDFGGATNNYGYWSGMNAATNKWAFYGSGTAASHFGGVVDSPLYATTTKCANAASPAVCAAAPAGAVAIPTGVTTVSLVVNTTAVTASSQIKLQADDSLTIAATTCNNTLATLVGGLAVTARTPGTSFTITYNGTIATNPLCVAYSIIN